MTRISRDIEKLRIAEHIVRRVVTDGESQAVVAAELRISQPTVSRWLARARRDYRKSYEDVFAHRIEQIDTAIDFSRQSFQRSVAIADEPTTIVTGHIDSDGCVLPTRYKEIRRSRGYDVRALATMTKLVMVAAAIEGLLDPALQAEHYRSITDVSSGPVLESGLDSIGGDCNGGSPSENEVTICACCGQQFLSSERIDN